MRDARVVRSARMRPGCIRSCVTGPVPLTGKGKTGVAVWARGRRSGGGWECFYRKCVRHAMPARPPDTIFFKTVTQWRLFAAARGAFGACRSWFSSCRPSVRYGADVWHRGLPALFRRRGSPLHICLDSGGWQAIVVPFRGQLAQMDRALASGAKGHRFESCIAHHATRRGVFGYTGNAPFLRGVPAPGDTPHPFPRRPSLRRPLVLVVFQKK